MFAFLALIAVIVPVKTIASSISPYTEMVTGKFRSRINGGPLNRLGPDTSTIHAIISSPIIPPGMALKRYSSKWFNEQ